MLWFEHILVTWACFDKIGLWDIFYSVAPDIPMILFLSMMNCSWKEMIDTWPYYFFYDIPHTFAISLMIENKRHRKIYCLHILLDLLTHTEPFGIRPFLPLEFRVNGIWDPIGWV